MILAEEPTDHSIEKNLMHVIWARGQEIGEYNHSPKSGLEKDKAFVPIFYKPDELKYHGHGDQRGHLSLNFYEEDKKVEVRDPEEADFCGGSWKTPKSCSTKKHNCEYYVKWEYFSRKDEIKFTIETTHTNTWTGIGFSEDQKMVSIH